MPPPMQPHSRINLAELKSQIVKKLGSDRANRYFHFLHRFISQKLSKSEFDKLCCWTLGRENLHLHNQLIRSVFKNACNGAVPPPPPPLQKETTKVVGKKEDADRQSGSISASIWPNGDVPPSPRKARSVIRDRRVKDRPSPLGPNGKTLHQSSTVDELVGKFSLENGLPTLCDLDRPVQHRHGAAEQSEVIPGGSMLRKMPQVKQSLPNDGVSVHNAGYLCPSVNEAGVEMEQDVDFNVSGSRSPLRAPLGIPFCPASVGGALRNLPGASSGSFASSVDNNELSDTETLRKRMEQIAGSEGLDGVSLDCANLLNNGLDAYLKRLIKSCIDLVRARSGHETVKHVMHKEHPQGKVINGVWLSHHAQAQWSIGSVEVMRDSGGFYPISQLDFKVAMELNPQQLGEDWPLLLEKICFHSYDKQET